MEFQDYYQILGVPKNATAREIRQAFRKLARRYHPDVAIDPFGAEDKFKSINEAYDVLGDIRKREQYDLLGASWQQIWDTQTPPNSYQPRGYRTGGIGDQFEFRFTDTGFSDFFNYFFRERNAPNGFNYRDSHREAHRPQYETRQNGKDIQGQIYVSLLEVLHGSIRVVRVRHQHSQTGQFSIHSFRMRIPRGIRNGQILRVARKGESGLSGGMNGDLYLRVIYAQHPDFEVRGTNLHHRLDMPPWKVIVGTTIRVPTLEGSITVRLPRGVTERHRLRVRYRGLPNPEGYRGSLIVRLNIQAAGRSPDDERIEWNKIGRTSTFRPPA